MSTTEMNEIIERMKNEGYSKYKYSDYYRVFTKLFNRKPKSNCSCDAYNIYVAIINHVNNQ